MTKFEKVVYIGCPWLFGTVLVIAGLRAKTVAGGEVVSVLMIGFGLICISLYCVCALLNKIFEKRQGQ